MGILKWYFQSNNMFDGISNTLLIQTGNEKDSGLSNDRKMVLKTKPVGTAVVQNETYIIAVIYTQ